MIDSGHRSSSNSFYRSDTKSGFFASIRTNANFTVQAQNRCAREQSCSFASDRNIACLCMGALYPKITSGRWSRAAGGPRHDRARSGADTRSLRSACSWPAPASNTAAGGHDQVADDRRAASGGRRDRTAGSAGIRWPKPGCILITTDTLTFLARLAKIS